MAVEDVEGEDGHDGCVGFVSWTVDLSRRSVGEMPSGEGR
jgi:hypothetical protein